MKVLKFGGSSVGNAESIKQVKKIIESFGSEKLILVFSAFGDTTDLLITAANKAKSKDNSYTETLLEIEKIHFAVIEEIFESHDKASAISSIKEKLNQLEEILEGIFHLEEFSKRTYDKVAGFGERLSNLIISEFLLQKKVDAKLYDSSEVIKTENVFGGAKILIGETYKNIRSLSLDNQISIFPGFISSSLEGEKTTLGRGGSDYTASLLASALKAEELQVWKDVNGMLTANPNFVESAKSIAQLSYSEALELSHFGANVLYPPTVQPALINNIPIRIKNTFNPEHEGTLITSEKNIEEKTPVRGVSSIQDISLITISGTVMFGLPGFSKRFFETLSIEGVSVIMITQGSSEQSITVAIMPEDTEKARKALSESFKYEIENGSLKPIEAETELSIVALVGNQMKNYVGISGKMFSVLGKNGINIRAIAQGSSESNVSAVIGKRDLHKALNVLNESFFEKEIKELNLFIVGIGNVGGKLMEQIASQQSYLLEEKRLRIKVSGIANSKKMIFDANGIDLSSWQESLNSSDKASNLEGFIDRIKELNLRNSIFIDNTASETVADQYENCLESSIGIVTCNKIAASDTYERYDNLKRLAQNRNVSYLFETNVGAGLPIIATINSLVSSGDKINAIQGVLSGSLNFIFNTFNETNTFEDVVRQAQKEGYTEPDPRLDLSGKDVMRKVLILAREAGYKLEMEDIQIENFLDDKYFEGNVDDFYALLKENGAYFTELYNKAKANKCRLKIVGEFDNGTAKVSLKEISEGHPMYELPGKDNIVMLSTNRYSEQPMIIQGAGAGAEVTASGVFADIIKYSTI